MEHGFGCGGKGRGGFGHLGAGFGHHGGGFGHHRGGFGHHRGGFGHHGAGFGPHGGGFGPRFGFGHHHVHPHAFPHGHDHEGPFGHLFDHDEDQMAEIAKENCRQYDNECQRGHCKKDKKHKHSKHVHKNSIDPVWTIVETKDGKFTVCIALGKDAKPEDVKLNVKERDLYIEIKMEKSSEDGTSHLVQVFTKKVTLPEEVKVEEIKSHLTPEGVLKIEGSVPVPEEIIITVSMDPKPTAPRTEN